MDIIIIFLIIFLPFSFYIWRMLAYTKNTVGAHSPFETTKTYYGNAGKAVYLNLAFLIVLSIFLLVVSGVFFFVMLPGIENWVIPKFFVCLLGLIYLLFGIYSLTTQFIIEIDYWKNGRDLDFTFYPEERKILLHQHNKIIHRDNIQKIETVTNAHFRMLRFYQRYTLSDDFTFNVVDFHPASPFFHDFLKADTIQATTHVTPLPLTDLTKFPLLRKIHLFFTRRLLLESLFLGLFFMVFYYLGVAYLNAKELVHSLPPEEITVTGGYICPGKKGGKAYTLQLLHEGKQYEKTVHRKYYFEAIEGKKITLLYDKANNNFLFEEEGTEPYGFFLSMIGIIVVLLAIRIIYLLVFPKTFN